MGMDFGGLRWVYIQWSWIWGKVGISLLLKSNPRNRISTLVYQCLGNHDISIDWHRKNQCHEPNISRGSLKDTWCMWWTEILRWFYLNVWHQDVHGQQTWQNTIDDGLIGDAQSPSWNTSAFSIRIWLIVVAVLVLCPSLRHRQIMSLSTIQSQHAIVCAMYLCGRSLPNTFF